MPLNSFPLEFYLTTQEFIIVHIFEEVVIFLRVYSLEIKMFTFLVLYSLSN